MCLGVPVVSANRCHRFSPLFSSLSSLSSVLNGEVDLGAHSFFPTPHPLKIYLCLVTMAYSCATFAGRVIQYTTQDK